MRTKVSRVRLPPLSKGSEGEHMAYQDDPKTRTIGYLPIEKVQTLKGWNEYLDKSIKLSALRTETQQAKNFVRDALKQRLDEKGDIDFAAEGNRIRVFQVFRKQQQGRRTRTLDLSSSFCDQPFEVAPEMNGLSETEQSIPEECAVTLDPITERLTTLMKKKMER
jgi:hypothetical protein